jgi:cobalt-zinc-cadmium efflux system outer membrane protein
MLQLSDNIPYKTAPLKPYANNNDLKTLKDQSVNHTAIATLKYKLDAAEAAVDLAKGKRAPDLTFTFFRELDFLDNKRQYFNGATLGITIPLWDFNSGEVAKARAESIKVKNEKQALEQELSGKLQQTYTHLGHLVEQAENYRTKILGPAEEVFNLTNKSFKSGEVNVLSLIDASNTYFDARKRYLELLYESSVELAELRLAAGLSLISSTGKVGGSL